MNLSRLKQKVAGLPQKPGVYFFYGKAESALGGRVKRGSLLYIGKATNLRSRVASYFRGDANLRINANPRIANVNAPELSSDFRSSAPVSNVPGRSEWIGSMMPLVEEIEFQQTDSVLEALILESNLIKKHQPKYNTLEKDDKSFAYFVITKEEFPRVLILRKTDLTDAKLRNDANLRMKSESTNKIQNTKYQIQYTKTFGPYTSKQQMQIALKIIRRIFPFHAGKQKTEKGCLDFQLGTCPGPYAGAISKEDYKKNIEGIKMILTGKKKRLLSGLEKEMKVLAKKNEFEKATEVRNKIFALQHIRDVALITRETEHETWNMKHETRNTEQKIQNTKYQIQNTRIEAYDISNISGTDAVGSMVVFVGGEPDKSQYRKFKIKTVEGSNDVAMMREVLLRRFKNDWAMPDLILLDGGQGHVNAINDLIVGLGLDVLVVGVAKGPTRKNLKLQMANFHPKGDQPWADNKVPMTQFPKQLQDFLNDKNLVKSIMDEAHRFAITFHRKLRGKNFL